MARTRDLPERIIGLKTLQSNNDIQIENHKEQFTSQKVLDEAKEQADKIVKDAIAYSNSLRQQILVEKRNWEQEQQELYKRTSDEGFQSGLKEGRDKGYEEFVTILSEARQIIDASKKDYDLYLSSSEEVILQLAMTVAEKIIGVHLSTKPEDFKNLVKNAIKEVKEHSDVTIHVSPQFYPYIVEQKEELLAILNRETDLFIYPQEELNETDCVIESSFGKINASVDTQLTEIKEKLFSLLLEE